MLDLIFSNCSMALLVADIYRWW